MTEVYILQIYWTISELWVGLQTTTLSSADATSLSWADVDGSSEYSVDNIASANIWIKEECCSPARGKKSVLYVRRLNVDRDPGQCNKRKPSLGRMRGHQVPQDLIISSSWEFRWVRRTPSRLTRDWRQKVKIILQKKCNNLQKDEQYPDFACSHEPYYYLDLHELNFPDRDERGCGLVNMTVHIDVVFYKNIKY